MNYRLFPYERRLGLREMESLGLQVLASTEDAAAAVGDATKAVARATYFETLGSSAENVLPTDQAIVEKGHLDLRDGQRARQATRYGLHGIHEYKGKFNPQVVRALCNVIDPDADLLFDPFCGCGTALIEGLRLGMDVVGIDQSPIAWFLATAKVEATASKSKARLAEDLLLLAERVAEELERGQLELVVADLDRVLGEASVAYLRGWFTEPAFAGISQALRLLSTESPSAAQRLAKVALSSVLRSVSLQLPEDLRIRRRPEPYTAPRIAPLFIEAITAIRRGLLEMDGWRELGNEWCVKKGSAHELRTYKTAREGQRRLIFTSPPYATALPYIDTDRLSVVALGLADAKMLAMLERDLVGSREWTRAEQICWDGRRTSNADRLPGTVTGLLSRIDCANSDGSAGFRRAAVSSLLYRYFTRMGDTFATWADVLDADESAVLIVGHNRTTAGGERIDITTPELLGHVAEARGFVVNELIKLETWPRYGMHSANGVSGEDALIMTRRR